ncbi:MAG: AMP-binding protein [Nitrospinaceae bacterium]|jgi:long-chain acyl-CoA synthetase|nr:AMP-binding protein [Nitrospinaceae bacterium]MBT3434808.1 AMP-binding protein [Nitrospinaceae bacterium]MBT4095217.1 AMP-binding protein [Nitrospinaceae bacterium]MBT4430242.1 AMP-binding protein [Nitrospinaceae bacterium]MBT5367876.1 AMP-binding protein [Nitrospinaceae bacterium]
METLIQLIDCAAREFPDTVALEGDVEGAGRISLTRTALVRRAAALAGRLVAAGVGPDDPVALLSPNRPEWAIGYFATLLAGGVLIPLDVNLRTGELSNILGRSGAVVLLTDGTKLEDARDLAMALSAPIQLFRIDEPVEADIHPLANWPGAKRSAGDLAVISFSSGTTGAPKGVMLTHGNIASNARATAAPFPCGEQDVFLSVLPLHHMLESTAGLLVPLIKGARVYYLASLNPRVMNEAMAREKISICLMVPALARLMHRRIMTAATEAGGLKTIVFKALFALSRAMLAIGLRLGSTFFPQVRERVAPSLRYFVSGGAALDPVIARDLLALGIEVIQGYGLTETSPVTHANRPGKGNRIGTVGPPIDGVEVKIAPAPGTAVGEGEILIKGPNVMKGYFGNPELTEEILQDGWFHTGDIGRVGRGGYLTICGRSKNVIVTESGKNIYPEEVEAELARSLMFSSTCVIGRKSPRGGEDVFAVVVLDTDAEIAGTEADREDVVWAELTRLSSELADYKRVSDFVIWPGEEMPRTTTLKIKREDVKAVLCEMPQYSYKDF